MRGRVRAHPEHGTSGCRTAGRSAAAQRVPDDPDDGALIYVAYAGVERDRPSSAQAPAGTVLGPRDFSVWMIAPLFETSAPKYAWLNDVQGVGRMVEYKEGAGGYVKYEIYSVR